VSLDTQAPSPLCPPPSLASSDHARRLRRQRPLPAIGRELGGALSGLQWVADSYTAHVPSLMLSAGALSDRVGARRAYGWDLASSPSPRWPVQRHRRSGR